PIGIAACLLLLGSSRSALAKPGKPPTGNRVEGRVLLDGAGRPAVGAAVIAVHLDSGKIFTASPSSADGKFSFSGLPFGYYEFAVDANGVLHAGTAVVNLA